MWIVGFCGAFVDSEAARNWREDIFGANADCDISDKQFALIVDVSFSRISEFKSGQGGLDARRLGSMPAEWQKAFYRRRAKRYCERIIEDAQIDKLIATLNLWMVRGMEMQLRKPRPVKAHLVTVEDKERSA